MAEATTSEVQLRVTHAAGKVNIDGVEGVKNVQLTPDAALKLASVLVKHADLAREQQATDG